MSDQIQEIITTLDVSRPQGAVIEARSQLILEMAGQGSGKSMDIGVLSAMMILDYPQALGFIAANTQAQLSQSTLLRVFETWKKYYDLYEYDAKRSPGGAFVVDKRPPPHFQTNIMLRRYDGVISFYNGANVFIGSLQNYYAHDGKEFAWAHLDETKDTKKAALTDVIMGRLRQYGLWYHGETGTIYFDALIRPEVAMSRGWVSWNPLYIHTSPAVNGVPWLNDMFKLDKFAKEIKEKVTQGRKAFFLKTYENKTVCIYPAHFNERNLPPGYIANQYASITDEGRQLKLICGYPFGKSGGEYFPKFSRDKHVMECYYTDGHEVLTGWDFNVVPYMTMLATQVIYVTRYLDEVGNKHDRPAAGYTAIEVMRLQVYREYCLDGARASIEEVAKQFDEDTQVDSGGNPVDMTYYGDSSGLNRIPGLNYSCYDIIKEQLFMYLHSSSKGVKNPNVTPLKRRDLLNAIFADKFPEIEIWIDPSCTYLINDLENVKLGPAGKVKSRVVDENTGGSYEELGHTSDALECLASELFKPFISLL